jgi:hypothetical protein
VSLFVAGFFALLLCMIWAGIGLARVTYPMA